MSRNKLYFLFLILSFAGYTWISWNLSQIHSGGIPVNFCLFRQVTGVPCPSCGTTHSVMAIIKGDFQEAIKNNPLGFIVFPVLMIIPFWILIDLIRRKNSFYRFYGSTEKVIGRKWVAYPAICLLLVNWFVNIYIHHGLR